MKWKRIFKGKKNIYIYLENERDWRRWLKEGRKEGRKGARGSRERVAHGGPLRLPNWPARLPDTISEEDRKLSSFSAARKGQWRAGGTLWFKGSRSGRHARSGEVLQRLPFLTTIYPFTFFTINFLFPKNKKQKATYFYA